jgi:hypothetical protein
MGKLSVRRYHTSRTVYTPKKRPRADERPNSASAHCATTRSENMQPKLQRVNMLGYGPSSNKDYFLKDYEPENIPI